MTRKEKLIEIAERMEEQAARLMQYASEFRKLAKRRDDKDFINHLQKCAKDAGTTTRKQIH